MDDKPPLKAMVSGHMIHLIFWGANHISGMAEARVINVCIFLILPNTSLI